MQVHASAVAIDGRACLITGAPGTGKSTLALELIALGGILVADDRADLRRQRDTVLVSPPEQIAGLIEARGAGLIRMPWQANVPLEMVTDLDRAPASRLPEPARREFLGCDIPEIAGQNRHGIASVIAAILRMGLADPESVVV